jgi:tripartite-type tricarboxylate transporter receptor subunit TctC
MSVNGIQTSYYPPQNTQKATVGANATSFSKMLAARAVAPGAGVTEYMKYLEKKYGTVTIQNVGKDQASLEQVGKRMGGNDVIIAPNIFEEMAASPEKAAYYEEKIDYFWNTMIPRDTAALAAKGLVF